MAAIMLDTQQDFDACLREMKEIRASGEIISLYETKGWKHWEKLYLSVKLRWLTLGADDRLIRVYRQRCAALLVGTAGFIGEKGIRTVVFISNPPYVRYLCPVPWLRSLLQRRASGMEYSNVRTNPELLCISIGRVSIGMLVALERS